MLFRPLIAKWAFDILKPPGTFEIFEECVTVPTEAGVADATLPCFRFSKEMKKPPAAVAQEWCTKLQAAAKPAWLLSMRADNAYINFAFDPNAYTFLVLDAIQKNKNFGNDWTLPKLKGTAAAIDFSSPNMAKPIGIHHIRSTVIGNSIANLLEFAQCNVHRINHIGDYGTTFGQLCYAFGKWGSKKELEARGIRHLLDIYVRFNQEMETDKSLQDKGKEWFAKLERKEADAQAMWQLFRDVSEKEFQKIYTRMGIRFTSMSGEAHYADFVEEALKRVQKFVKIEKSDGADVVFLEGFKTPILLRKSDGTTLYSTRDIAAAFDRLKKYSPNFMLYVVAIQQKLYFEQLFALLRKTDFNPATTLEHVSFGMLSFKEGTMSTRKGKIIFLDEVLDQAVQKATEIILEKNPECPDREKVAEAVGIGAVVFNDLKARRGGDVQFSWEEALNFEGDSGPYIQYSHARTHALFERNGKPSWSKLSSAVKFETEAFKLAWTLSLFPHAVERATLEREPCHVSQFLLHVCAAFNAFYNKVIIRDLTGDAKEAHLQLVACAQQVLHRGLSLLGLKAPERI